MQRCCPRQPGPRHTCAQNMLRHWDAWYFQEKLCSYFSYLIRRMADTDHEIAWFRHLVVVGSWLVSVLHSFILFCLKGVVILLCYVLCYILVTSSLSSFDAVQLYIDIARDSRLFVLAATCWQDTRSTICCEQSVATGFSIGSSHHLSFRLTSESTSKESAALAACNVTQ